MKKSTNKIGGKISKLGGAVLLSVAAAQAQASGKNEVERIMMGDPCHGINSYNEYVKCRGGKTDFAADAKRDRERLYIAQNPKYSYEDEQYIINRNARGDVLYEIPNDPGKDLETPSDLKINGGENNLGIFSNNGLTGVEYSDQYWVIFNVGIQVNTDGTQSFLLQGSIGEEEKRILAWAWFSVWEDKVLMFMGEHFIQEREFQNKAFDVTQNKIGVNFRFKSFEIWASYSKSQDEKLQDTDLIIDSTTLWQKFSVQNSFVGQTAKRAYAANTFDLTQNSTLKATLWLSDIDGDSNVDGGLKYTYYMGHGWQMFVDVSRVGKTDKYSAGYEGNIWSEGATWNFEVAQVEWPNGYSDTRYGVNLKVPFGYSAKRNYTKPTSNTWVDLDASLRDYVSSEKSYQVLGQVKETGRTLLVEIDKTGLPAGATLDTQTGEIVLNGLNAFTGFTSVLLDGVPTSSAPFSVVSNTIKIDPALLSVGTYVLTTNATPAQTITIVVAQGSIIVKSITIDTVDAATTAAKPTLDSKTDTTINTTAGSFTDSDGTRNITVELYSDAALTILVATAANGDFTGLTQNTAYYAVTKWEWFNAGTSSWEIKRSAALTVTTDVTPDGATTITVPTLDSKTDTTINTTVGTFSDTDGVQNVTVELYSDAGLTTLVTSATNWDFTGLSANTTYYVVTKWEAFNATTSSWETKRSSALSVTTSATPDTTPNAFSFTDVTGQTRSTLIESSQITVSGINTSTAISVTGGEYSINGWSYTSTGWTVNNGDTVKVRHTTSGSYSTTVNTTLTIGGVSDTFSSTTEAAPADTTPDAFIFTDQTWVALSTLTESSNIVVSGINASTAISVSGGEYQIDGWAWTSTSGTVVNGAIVKVRHTSSGSYSTTVNTTLTIGGVNDTFSSTTEADPNTAPTASDGSINGWGSTSSMNFDLSTLVNDAETSDSWLTLVIVSWPTKWVISNVSGVTWTYTINFLEAWNDSMTYKVRDPQWLESSVQTFDFINFDWNL